MAGSEILLYPSSYTQCREKKISPFVCRLTVDFQHWVKFRIFVPTENKPALAAGLFCPNGFWFAGQKCLIFFRTGQARREQINIKEFSPKPQCRLGSTVV